MESSDDDEYHLSGTTLTEATETSDDDEYSIGTTMTRTIEESDPDFFMLLEETK
jgi:hypothetical protein